MSQSLYVLPITKVIGLTVITWDIEEFMAITRKHKNNDVTKNVVTMSNNAQLF